MSINNDEEDNLFEIVELLTVMKHHKIANRWLPLLNIKPHELLDFHYIQETKYNEKLKKLKQISSNDTEAVPNSRPKDLSYKTSVPLLPIVSYPSSSNLQCKSHIKTTTKISSDDVTIQSNNGHETGSEVDDSVAVIITSSSLLKTNASESEIINKEFYKNIHPIFSDECNFSPIILEKEIGENDVLQFLESEQSILNDFTDAEEEEEAREALDSFIFDTSQLQSCYEETKSDNEIKEFSSPLVSEVELLSELFQDIHFHEETLSSFNESELFSDDFPPQRKKTKPNPRSIAKEPKSSVDGHFIHFEIPSSSLSYELLLSNSDDLIRLPDEELLDSEMF